MCDTRGSVSSLEEQHQLFLFTSHVCVFLQGSDWGTDGVLLFEPHVRPVACMAFSSAHPTNLLSLSYDGSVRCMDIEKSVFDDVRYLY